MCIANFESFFVKENDEQLRASTAKNRRNGIAKSKYNGGIFLIKASVSYIMNYGVVWRKLIFFSLQISKVDNLTYRTTPEDLRRVFERCGEVGDIYIPRDRFSRESRGFAFVRYDK